VLVGHPEWLADARFSSLASRTRNRDAIEESVSAWIAARTRAQVLEAFEAADLPVGPINSMADLAADSHLERAPSGPRMAGAATGIPTRVPKLHGEAEPAHAAAADKPGATVSRATDDCSLDIESDTATN
jgi:crotonobetainyl-CoA:carnitine CoA-transferase CaiB-like acyl-CoA transferase